MQFYRGLYLICRAVIAVPVRVSAQSMFRVARIFTILLWSVLEMLCGLQESEPRACLELTGYSQFLCGPYVSCCGVAAVPIGMSKQSMCRVDRICAYLTCRKVTPVPTEICKQSMFMVDRLWAVVLRSALEMSHSHRCAYRKWAQRRFGVLCFE